MAGGFSDYLGSTAALIERARSHGLDGRVGQAIERISAALSRGLPLLVCGNGGSAADAMHIAGELAARFLIERPGLKAIALGANTATLTAWSNDYDYATAYAREVEAFAAPGGVVWGISTSGNSKNVIAALEKAKSLGMSTIAMTGQGGGKLAPLADILLDVPSRATPRIQEVHICLYHYICQEVEVRCAAALAAERGKARARS
jgi:D-sedoheptulose 7-phosphate isomerase